ncbi:MAG TPA: hypothetical protein VN760_12075 [Casimicrobiaceae bacterium]|nr:hypothetical protein [Casimicrobiaceae bacterium]
MTSPAVHRVVRIQRFAQTGKEYSGLRGDLRALAREWAELTAEIAQLQARADVLQRAHDALAAEKTRFEIDNLHLRVEKANMWNLVNASDPRE